VWGCSNDDIDIQAVYPEPDANDLPLLETEITAAKQTSVGLLSKAKKARVVETAKSKSMVKGKSKLVAKGKAPTDRVREQVAEQLILSDTDSNEDMLIVDEPRSGDEELSVAEKSEVNDPCVRKPTKPSRPYSFLKPSKIRCLRSVVSEPFRPKKENSNNNKCTIDVNQLLRDF